MTVMQEFKDISLDMTVLEFKKLFLSNNVWARKYTDRVFTHARQPVVPS
jgi:hypothetical protein